jgi:hypothetical protein
VSPAPVITVGGTWEARPGSDQWARPGSPFDAYLLEAGVSLYHPEASWAWDTALGGVVDDAPWYRAGISLARYIAKYGAPASVIGHSHGGNVIAAAAWVGARFEVAITVAMPVRQDMRGAYRALHQNTGRWAHVYSDESGPGATPWQALGEVRLTDPASWWRVVRPVREIALAHPLLYIPGQTHEQLITPELWRTWALHTLLTAPVPPRQVVANA